MSDNNEKKSFSEKFENSKFGQWGSKKVGKFLRWQVTAVCAAVVIVVAGVGMFAWHETPSFCGAICHNSMDPYLPTYESEPGQPTVDKWGNEVVDASAMMSAVHREYGEVTCLMCHVPSIEEQVTEGVEYVSGGYYAPLSERSLSDLVAYRNVDDPTEFCLNESCHNMTKADLTKATSNMARNPHAWHHFEYTCTDCHKAHRASVMICSNCHDDSKIPSGWLSGQQAKELPNIYGAYANES